MMVCLDVQYKETVLRVHITMYVSYYIFFLFCFSMYCFIKGTSNIKFCV